MSAPRKAKGGLNRVLFVRADQALLDALDAAAKALNLRGARFSRADAARVLLWDALREGGHAR